jgi:hypothetical protein
MATAKLNERLQQRETSNRKKSNSNLETAAEISRNNGRMEGSAGSIERRSTFHSDA